MVSFLDHVCIISIYLFTYLYILWYLVNGNQIKVQRGVISHILLSERSKLSNVVFFPSQSLNLVKSLNSLLVTLKSFKRLQKARVSSNAGTYGPLQGLSKWKPPKRTKWQFPICMKKNKIIAKHINAKWLKQTLFSYFNISFYCFK